MFGKVRQEGVKVRGVTMGIEVDGFRITPAILRTQLESSVSIHRLNSLLNPNDKQDVVLAFSLLREIWALPPANPEATPIFIQARKALKVFGEFARHLITPYIDLDMSLGDQLESLSAAAHLLLHLYTIQDTRRRFLPTQCYTDIMIMVKNAFFCVAKIKVDNPTGKFHLIQMGTDREEKFFGLIRTAAGTDANVDIMQLGSRASGLTEVAAILALHPEWDKSPRRLNLSPLASQGAIDNKSDHLNPVSWRGSLGVANVNLHTCWLRGQQKATDLVPQISETIKKLKATDCDCHAPKPCP